MPVAGFVAPGWDELVARRRQRKYAYYAERRRIRVPVYRDQLSEVVSELINPHLEVRKRCTPEGLAGILRDQRVRTVFETGTTRGVSNLEYRRQTESALFGIGYGADARRRPIYGYLQGSEEDALYDFGPVVLHLSSSVAERTTVTIGDTLWQTDNGTLPCLAPTPLADPTDAALHTDSDFAGATTIAETTPAGYSEAQIHGGVELADIESVTFLFGIAIPGEIVRALERVGIASRVVNGVVP
jgi:hypothetical protein